MNKRILASAVLATGLLAAGAASAQVYLSSGPHYPYIAEPARIAVAPALVVGPAATPAVVAGTTYSVPSTTVLGAGPVYVVPSDGAVVLNRPLLGQPAVVRPREITTHTFVLPR